MVAQDSFDDTPFVTLLERQGLDEQLRHVLLHAIALSPWGSPAQASASSTGGLQSVDSLCLFPEEARMAVQSRLSDLFSWACYLHRKFCIVQISFAQQDKQQRASSAHAQLRAFRAAKGCLRS